MLVSCECSAKHCDSAVKIDSENENLYLIISWGSIFDLRISWWLCSDLVDPASSHMLVSKIKPCKYQHKSLQDKPANGSLKQLLFIWQSTLHG